MIVGIDPGLKGGIAMHDRVFPMPVQDGKICGITLAGYLRPNNTRIAYVEKVGAMPKQGVVSMFNFGFGCGTIEGVLLSLGYVVRYVTPQKWKKFVLGTEYTHDKDGAIAFCRKHYPNVDLIQPRCRTPHDGIADSVAIRHYGCMMES